MWCSVCCSLGVTTILIAGCGKTSGDQGQVAESDPPSVEAGFSGGAGGGRDASVKGVDVNAPPPDVAHEASASDPDNFLSLDGVEWAEQGWRSSTGIFAADRCANASVTSHAVWSEPAGIHLLVSTSVNAFADQSGPEGSMLAHNDGSGWQQLYVDAVPVGGWVYDRGLTGRLAGALLLYPGDCPLRLISGGSTSCAPLPVPDASEGLRPQHVFVVSDTLAYVVDQPRIWRSDGAEWTVLAEIPEASDLTALWADESTIVVVGTRQEIYVYRTSDPRFVRQTGVPAGDYYATWAFGPDDIWAGNNGGQLVHFDGTSWRLVRRSSACVGEAVHGLWGARGELFVLMPNELVRWDGAAFETIASGPCDGVTFRDIWGNSPTEVFITLATSTCSVAWFDGERLRQF